MLFADKSGSMTFQTPRPFDTVRDGLINMADHIFGSSEETNAFQEVHTIWFDGQITPFVTKKKADYIANLRKNVHHGGTSFIPCFDYITKTL